MKKIAAFLLFALIAGCAAKNPATVQPLHPGAVNAFDSQAWEILRIAQATIEHAAQEVQAYPAVKPELNRVIDAYNIAQAAYKTYHEDAVAGKPADADSLRAMLARITTDLAALVTKLHPEKSALQWSYA